ncbi:serine/threonine-protein kinase [Umezakia ovalisporum]|jgi:serine/threonine-protein kinase|uniref:Protein kinase n=2 Tax=Umezakia ovalisporum TaxID=75695 RepID=A0AA43GW20_9CYAN|nr:serine/threonine protein kinase [Umezakia ovalisporum]MBI1241968.1 protein kinase [Nostoc sp. RI_552]MDH6056775.1 protein kinase [Umezakia ovalisporum FSS-43]MDH6062706.1 protein kinase [Umezakia ovalisporum FSS-62]MDH6066095.1 protein kinase [Umezakia ovalisporum APH033B]MDH6072190.1 protein kinase [Umezakia ovalisporum CobakiLakeA]
MLAGTTLQDGKYTLIQEIGRGGFGITFKATHNYLGQEVVMKTINEKLRQHPDFAKFERQFQDEARRLATCIHPHIVRVSDFFIENGLPYMVMEYVRGDTLGEAFVLPAIPLPEPTAIHYIRQIGSALQVIHNNGLLHRDIKPDNIILRKGSQEVVLIDFGIAREFNNGVRQTHTGMVSEGYAPLEQYLTQASRTPATDVYGLAATLYALLTGQVPLPALLRDREKMPSPRELQPQLSAAVNQAIMRGMAIESQFRPATVAQWLQLLPESKININNPVPTQAVPTIVLPVQEPGKKLPQKNCNSPQKQLLKLPKQKAYQIFIAVSVAFIAGTTGFGITKLFSNSQPQSSSTSVLEKPTIKPETEKPSADSPSLSEEEENNRQNPPASSPPNSVQVRTPRQGQRYIPVAKEQTLTTTSTNIESQRKPTQTQGKPTATKPRTIPSIPPTPSLVERLREIRDTRQVSPPPSPENNLPTTKRDSTSSPAARPSNPIIPPREPSPAPAKRLDSPPVVVPTTESKPSSLSLPEN